MDEDEEFTEIDDVTEVLEESDLVLGFAWHDEEEHWDLESYSFPDTFDESQAERLAELAREFAARITSEGLTLPPLEDVEEE